MRNKHPMFNIYCLIILIGILNCDIVEINNLKVIFIIIINFFYSIS